MRSLDRFIVKPVNGRRYDNIKNIGGVDIITSVSQEDHMFTNRFAEVVSIPLNYKGSVVPGDVLVVHHNVFKIYYDMKGNERSGRSFFKDDLFFIEEDQFYMYRHDNNWITHPRYCFVKPIKQKEYMLEKGSAEEPLYGVIRYISEELLALGLNVGDEISFTPDSEYEFTVDGEKLYRMFNNDITIKWTQKN